MNKINTRRKFLKKAVYAVPVVVALGTLKTPLNAASSAIGTITTGGSTYPATDNNQNNLVNSLFGGNS